MRAWLVVAVLLSGCATVQTDEPLDPVTGRPLDEAGLPVLDDDVAIAGVTWLNATSGPEAPITAFRWTIPAGAGWQDDGAWEAAINVVSDAAVDSYAILAFAPSPGGMQWVGGQAADKGWVKYTRDGEQEMYNYTQSRAGAWLRLRGDTSMAGQDLFVVVALEAGIADVPMKIFAYTKDPWSQGDAARRINDLADLDAAWPRPVAEADQVGKGAGFAMGSYSRVIWPWADQDSEMHIGDLDITVGGVAGELATAAYSFQSPFEAGWSHGVGYVRNDGKVGRWGLEGAAHGTDLHDVGLVANHPDPMVDAPLSVIAGYPIYQFVAEGPGSSEHTLTLETMDLGEETYVFIEAVSLGATLEDLLGQPSQAYYRGWGTFSRWTQTLTQVFEP